MQMFVHAQGVESSSLQELVAARHHNPSSLPALGAKPQSPASQCQQGRGARQQGCGGEEGKDPQGCLSLLSRRKQEFPTQGQAGWMGRAHGGGPLGRKILRNNIIISIF